MSKANIKPIITVIDNLTSALITLVKARPCNCVKKCITKRGINTGKTSIAYECKRCEVLRKYDKEGK